MPQAALRTSLRRTGAALKIMVVAYIAIALASDDQVSKMISRVGEEVRANPGVSGADILRIMKAMEIKTPSTPPSPSSVNASILGDVEGTASHFNPAQSDPASPISDATSICRAWYISDGPVNYGSNKAAADALKSAADGTWRKGTDQRKGTPPTTIGQTTDGTGWAVGYKHGCTEVANSAGTPFTICGCYEIWCPVRMQVLSHPDDMATRTTCYSARAVFGCYDDGTWLDNCGWQLPGSVQPGAGTASGRFVKAWEQLVL